MKKITLLIVSFFILCAVKEASATHAVGANISYTHDTLNQYTVTVKFYRFCGDSLNPFPTQAPTTVDVSYTSAICGYTNTLTFNQIPGTGQEIPTGQFPPCYVTSCSGGTGYGVQEYVYRGTINLPMACTDWVIATSINARNQIITTLQNPGTLSLYVEATLDNLNAPVNNSPVFSTYPVSRFCINHTFNYNQGATDPDGDSLVFSLVDALTATFGAPPVPSVVPYVTTPITYSGAYPISSTPPAAINPQTGNIILHPDLVQVGVFAVLVQEYRNGILIGSVRRDMQVNIEATCNFPPNLSLADVNGVAPGNGGINGNCLDSTLLLRLISPVLCSTVAPDGSDFRMQSPSGLPIPVIRAVPINCINGKTDSIELHLYFPYIFENGYYDLWSKIGSDGNTLLNDCNNPLPEYDTSRYYFTNCYDERVNLTNVTVDNINTNIDVDWTLPSNMGGALFHCLDIFRSNHPDYGYTKIDSLFSSTAVSYTDNHVNVGQGPYSYAIAIHLNSGYEAPPSDSIQSIFLTDSIYADSLNLLLRWTSYWGWPNAVYQVMQSSDNGASFQAVANASTAGTSYVYAKPSMPGHYIVRIETTNGSLVSRSNWLEFDVIKAVVVPHNVIALNGFEKNQTFTFDNLQYYPNSKLSVFNRWGRKVYESNNYQNDWKGGGLEDGVYYWVMKVADKSQTELTGTLDILGNK